MPKTQKFSRQLWPTTGTRRIFIQSSVLIHVTFPKKLLWGIFLRQQKKYDCNLSLPVSGAVVCKRQWLFYRRANFVVPCWQAHSLFLAYIGVVEKKVTLKFEFVISLPISSSLACFSHHNLSRCYCRF